MIPPQRIIPLETLSEDGKPPKSRIKDASDASQISDAVVYANQERSRFNARLRGMFDGNPPYSPSKLRSEAQAWRTNVSFLEGKAISSAALVPYYDLFSGAKYYAQVCTNTKEGTDEDRDRWSNVITEEFDYLLKSYEGFDFNVQQKLTDMIRYGKGILVWRDSYDWRFRCVPQHHVYVLDGTDCYAGNLDVLVIRERWRVNELWKYIEDKDFAAKVGWNADATAQAIINAMPDIEGDTSTKYDFEWIQQRIKDRDIFYGVRASMAAIRHVLVREFNGKVSHYIIEERRAGLGTRQAAMLKDQTSDNSGVPYEFLYACTEKFDDFSQFIATFFLETSDGSWNGAQGLGHDIFSMMALKDRIKCSAADLMFLRTGVNLQAKNATSAQKMSIIRFGPVNILPPDCDVQQSTILGDIESPMVMDRMLDQVITNNTGVYRQRQERPQGNPRTAREVSLEYQTQAVLSNSGVNRYYLRLDPFYAEVYRRVARMADAEYPKLDDEGTKLAKAFFDRCKARGVPMSAIKNVLYVRAYRNAGNGSMMMRQQSIAETLPFFGMLPEDGKQNFLNFALASIHGQSMTDLFNPQRNGNALPNTDTALATIENAVLKVGSPVIVTADQNGFTHSNIHLAAASQAAQSLTQGANPAEVAAFIENVGKHVTAHLQTMQGNKQRQGEVKQIEAQLKQLAALHDKLIEQVKEMQAQEQSAQQNQQQVMTAQQLENAQVQSDIQRRDAKTAASMRQSSAKTQQKMALDDATTAAKIRNDNLVAQAEAASKTLKAEHDYRKSINGDGQ